MHGAWTHDQDIVIVALRLGTNYNWTQIEEEFNKWFPQAPARRKDIESRYNKTLKLQRGGVGRGMIAVAIDDYRHYRTLQGVPAEHSEWVRAALRVLHHYPEDRVVAENPRKSFFLGFPFRFPSYPHHPYSNKEQSSPR